MITNPSKESRTEKFLRYATIISVLPLIAIVSMLMTIIIAALTEQHSDFATNAGNVLNSIPSIGFWALPVSPGVFFLAYTVCAANRLQPKQNNNQPG